MTISEMRDKLNLLDKALENLSKVNAVLARVEMMTERLLPYTSVTLVFNCKPPGDSQHRVYSECDIPPALSNVTAFLTGVKAEYEAIINDIREELGVEVETDG